MYQIIMYLLEGERQEGELRGREGERWEGWRGKHNTFSVVSCAVNS